MRVENTWFNLDLFPQVNYYVNEASVTITPPEGATIESPKLSEIGASDTLARNVFQDSLTVNRNGLTYLTAC